MTISLTGVLQAVSFTKRERVMLDTEDHIFIIDRIRSGLAVPVSHIPQVQTTCIQQRISTTGILVLEEIKIGVLEYTEILK